MYKPIFPYNESQIILNSDRVLLNSKKDSIFLFSSKVISLSSIEGIHINTDENVHINSNKIQLGLNANSPIPLGDNLLNIFDKLFKDLESVGNQLLDATDSNNNAIPSVQTAGNSIIKSINRLKPLLKNMNSTQNYTL